MVEYGAVLFRGFPINEAKDFDNFVKATGYNNFRKFFYLFIQKSK